jgi:hypothetical protein
VRNLQDEIAKAIAIVNVVANISAATIAMPAREQRSTCNQAHVRNFALRKPGKRWTNASSVDDQRGNVLRESAWQQCRTPMIMAMGTECFSI